MGQPSRPIPAAQREHIRDECWRLSLDGYCATEIGHAKGLNEKTVRRLLNEIRSEIRAARDEQGHPDLEQYIEAQRRLRSKANRWLDRLEAYWIQEEAKERAADEAIEEAKERGVEPPTWALRPRLTLTMLRDVPKAVAALCDAISITAEREAKVLGLMPAVRLAGPDGKTGAFEPLIQRLKDALSTPIEVITPAAPTDIPPEFEDFGDLG